MDADLELSGQAGQEGGDCGGDKDADHPLCHVLAGLSSSLRSVRLSTLRIWRSIASPAVQQFSSLAVPRRQTGTRRAMATNSAIQTKKTKNAVGVRSGWPQKQVQLASETTKKTRKKHLPAHHPNTNKLTTTEQKQSQEKVDKTDKTAEKRRAASTAATQSGAYIRYRYRYRFSILYCL